MKMIKILFLVSVFGLTACQVSTLTDVTANQFIATATQGEYDDKIKVAWIKTDYYKNFTVSRSTDIFGTYIKVSGHISGEEFDDTNIDEGISYYYKVQGYNDIGTPMHITDYAEGYAGASGGFLPPENVKLTPYKRYLRLDWDRSPGAVSYEILRGEEEDRLESIATVHGLHYVDEENVVSGIKYYYKVKAIKLLEHEGEMIPFPSDNSETVVGQLFGSENLAFGSPAGLYSDKIELSWLPTLADKYMIFRSTRSTTLGSVVCTLDVASDQDPSARIVWEDTSENALSGRAYYYTLVYMYDGTPTETTTIRSYVKVEGAPPQVQNVNATKGEDPSKVTVTWEAIPEVSAYEISRATSPIGPWILLNDKLTNPTYTDTPPTIENIFSYYYVVTSINDKGIGLASESVEGWANRPPINIKASEDYDDKVILTWDPVLGAQSYTITFSDKENGSFKPLGTSTDTGYTHFYDIGDQLTRKDMFYRISVTTAAGTSDPSSSVKGKIQKTGVPENIKIIGNNTATKTMSLLWDGIPTAQKYRVYRAALKHSKSDPAKLVDGDFKYLGESESPAYIDSFNSYPIRRYVYRIHVVDRAGVEGDGIKTVVTLRYPVDLIDFAKDVDLTIIQAQMRIPNFGANGSGGTVYGRESGNYVYKASMGGAKNEWNYYSSFEVVLNGSPSVNIDIFNFSAKLNGTMTASGHYTGSVTYHGLNAYDGGKVFAGDMTITYDHPTKGRLQEKWNYMKAAGYLQSVVLSGSENAPGYPSYEAGGG